MRVAFVEMQAPIIDTSFFAWLLDNVSTSYSSSNITVMQAAECCMHSMATAMHASRTCTVRDSYMLGTACSCSVLNTAAAQCT
jgi:hypothetical protein